VKQSESSVAPIAASVALIDTSVGPIAASVELLHTYAVMIDASSVALDACCCALSTDVGECVASSVQAFAYLAATVAYSMAVGTSQENARSSDAGVIASAIRPHASSAVARGCSSGMRASVALIDAWVAATDADSATPCASRGTETTSAGEGEALRAC